jgi:diguanylate cyclase (GGDEF)-like protein
MFQENEVELLLDVGESIDATQNLTQLGNLIVDKTGLMLHAKKVSIMLLDKVKKDLYIWAASQMTEEAKMVRVEFGQMFAGWVAKEGQPLLVKNVDSEFPQFSKVKTGRYKSESFIIAPIKSEGQTLGVVNVTERQDSEVFSEEDVKLLLLINYMVALQMSRIRLFDKVDSLTTTDGLTGLYNHRYIQERLNEEIDRSQRYHRDFSLIILGVDNFKEYNETYGYAMGDLVLTQMANIIKDNLRTVDIVSRYSGEAFAVLLPDINKRQAAIVADKLREKIEKAVFVERRDSPLEMSRLTVSVGVAQYNIRDSKEKLLKQVMAALEEAKIKGKNRVCVNK